LTPSGFNLGALNQGALTPPPHPHPTLPATAVLPPTAAASAADGALAALSDRSLGDALREMLNQRASKDRPHALVLFDIDQLQRTNQTHGDLTGDRVLEGLATILRRLAMHDGLVVARAGDDEFAVLIRSATPGQAEAFADAVRSWVRRLPSVLPPLASAAPHDSGEGPTTLELSVSAGVACARSAVDGGVDGKHLVAAAREALRSAKRAGGDRVSVA
jgi:diguanylate cyclase (GGDEF)-like protein